MRAHGGGGMTLLSPHRHRATSRGPATGITFSLATPEDDADLRRLLAQTPMDGGIRLSFLREPSYLQAARIQGTLVQVLVARVDGEIVGVGSRALRPSWVNGEQVTAGYLSDLRIHPSHRGGTMLQRGYRKLRELHDDGRAAIYSTVIVEDNERALSALTSSRAGLPTYTDLGRILTPMIPLTRQLKPFPGCITRGSTELMPRILRCVNRNRLQLAPLYHAADIGPRGRLHGLRPDDFFVLWRGETIAGVIAVWDQRSFRQTVVDGYAGTLARVRPLLNLVRRPRLPAPGSTLAFAYVALVSTADDEAFRTLLRYVVNSHVGSDLDHLVVGLHERDSRTVILDDYPQTRFAGRLFAVTFDGPPNLDNRVPHVEVALL